MRGREILNSFWLLSQSLSSDWHATIFVAVCDWGIILFNLILISQWICLPHYLSGNGYFILVPLVPGSIFFSTSISYANPLRPYSMFSPPVSWPSDRNAAEPEIQFEISSSVSHSPELYILLFGYAASKKWSTKKSWVKWPLLKIFFLMRLTLLRRRTSPKVTRLSRMRLSYD